MMGMSLRRKFGCGALAMDVMSSWHAGFVEPFWG